MGASDVGRRLVLARAKSTEVNGYHTYMAPTSLPRLTVTVHGRK